jgi:hypothetical protein
MLDALALFKKQNKRPQSAGCSASELAAQTVRSPASSSLRLSSARSPASSSLRLSSARSPASSSSPHLSSARRVSSPRASDGVQYLGRSRRAECTLPGDPVNGGGGRLWLMAGERGQLELRVAEARKEDLFYVRTGFEAQGGQPRGSSLEVRLLQKHTGQALTLLSLQEVQFDDTRRCVLPLSLEPVHTAGGGVLHVLLDGKHVRGSPYAVHVRPAAIHPAATLLLSEDGSADAADTTTGVTGRLRLVLRDA